LDSNQGSSNLGTESSEYGTLGGDGIRYIGSYHFLRIDNAIEFSFRHEAELQCCGLEREVIVIRIVGNLRSLVIADYWRERCDQHQRLLDILVDLLQIRLGPFHQELPEVRA